MSKTTNKFAPEVRERAVRMVLGHEGDHPSRRSAITSIAEKIGCSGHTLLEWVKKAEVNSGKRAGMPTDMADHAGRHAHASITLAASKKLSFAPAKAVKDKLNG
jgi:transposase-like protein